MRTVEPVERNLAAAIGVTVILVSFVQSYSTLSLPTASLGPLLMLAVIPLVVRSARRQVGARGFAAVAFSLAVLSLPSLFGCWGTLHDLRIAIPRTHQGYLDHLMGLILAPAIFLVSWLLTVIVFAWTARAGHRWGPAVRGSSVLSLATLAVLLAGSLARASHCPDTDHGEAAALERRMIPVTSGRRTETGPGYQLFEDEVGGALIRRLCSKDRCTINVGPVGSPADELTLKRRGFVTRADETIEALVYERAIVLGDGSYRWSFIAPDFGLRPMPLRDLAPRLSPPRGWIAGAAAGLALGLGALALRLRRARTLRTLAAGREGILDDAGFISFPEPSGGQPMLRAPEGSRAPAGPCVVLDAPTAFGSAYRGEAIPRAQRVLSGSKGEHLELARASLFNLDAFILAASSLLGAPLLASLFHGLVF